MFLYLLFQRHRPSISRKRLHPTGKENKARLLINLTLYAAMSIRVKYISPNVVDASFPFIIHFKTQQLNQPPIVISIKTGKT